MTNKLRFNKKAMTVSIGLLVLLTFLVCGVSLFLFLTEKNQIVGTIDGTGYISYIYEREILLNDFLKKITDESSKGAVNEEEFIAKFKNNLDHALIPVDLFILDSNGKIYFPEYVLIINQLREENIKIESDLEGRKRVIFSLEIEINDEVINKAILENHQNKINYSISYNLNKEFYGYV